MENEKENGEKRREEKRRGTYLLLLRVHGTLHALHLHLHGHLAEELVVHPGVSHIERFHVNGSLLLRELHIAVLLHGENVAELRASLVEERLRVRNSR